MSQAPSCPDGAGPEAIYVQRASLNGDPLERPLFDHGDIAAGGVLELEMGGSPSEWGRE